MRAFIYGTEYIQNPQRAELVQMWIELNQYLNPEFPLVVIDSGTDPIWRALIPQTRDIEIHTVKEGDPLPPLQPGLNWINFPENLGHLSVHGVDGWGRAFCRGVELAIAQNYDYAVNIECDLLFRPKVIDVLKMQHDKQIKFLTAWERYHHFMENCICFMNVDYLRRSDFIGRYDWRAQRQDSRLPELRMEDLTMDELFIKPWRGLRDNYNECRPEHIPQLDYLTQTRDSRLYYLFMQQIMPDGWQPPSQRGLV